MSNWEDVQHNIDGWMTREEGATLVGRYIGFITVRTKFAKEGRLAYLVQSERAVTAIPAGQEATKDDAEEFPAGSTIALLESGGTRAMNDIRVGTRVAIRVTGTKDVGKGNEMTVFDIKRDKRSLGNGPYAERVPIAAEEPRQQRFEYQGPREEQSPDIPDDDVPF